LRSTLPINASALQAACLVLDAVNALRCLARIQRPLDVAIPIMRLRALERFRQPLDKAPERSRSVAHQRLPRRMEDPATLEWCTAVAHTVWIGISASVL
jgi:hypothetical protein